MKPLFFSVGDYKAKAWYDGGRINITANHDEKDVNWITRV